MLSKKEIEKAKETTQNYIKDTPIAPFDCLMNIERESAITLLQYTEQLENKIKEMEESKEVKEAMEVAGLKVTALVSLKHENERLRKGQASLMSSRKKWKDRYYKTRKVLSKQSKMIDEMAYQLAGLHNLSEDDCFIPREYSDIDDCVKKASCTECIKQYFEKKVEEK